jgi:nucleoside-diphosphate-sugar epimerase
LIYLSSGAVYYGLKGLVSVASAVNPTFTYGISKLASEHYARAARENDRLARLTIFRLFYAYGRYDKERRLVPRIMQHVASGKQEPFMLNGTGISETSPLDARDVAAILLKSAFSGIEGLYDLCGTEYLKLDQAVAEIGRGLGAEVSARNNGIPESTPVVFHADAAGTWKTFGLESPRKLREGVQQLQSWLLSRQED